MSAAGALTLTPALAQAMSEDVSDALVQLNKFSPASAALAVHRIRKGRFAVAGIDTAELRFDLSVVGRATIGSAAVGSNSTNE